VRMDNLLLSFFKREGRVISVLIDGIQAG
jgi:hypothetical protein